MKNRTCTAFEEYKDVPEMASLDSMEYDLVWFTSKLSGATGALRAEAIKLSNWIIRFRCASEELLVVITNMAAVQITSPLPWANYRVLMACCIVFLDKNPGVHIVGIRETLCWALSKLIMMAAGF